MALNLPALVNGKNYDWCNIEVILLGTPIIGITKITYSRDRESVNNPGAGPEPVSYGNKGFTYNPISLTVHLDELEAIRQTAPNKSILEIPPFSITVAFSGDGVNFTTHKLKNCRITKDEVSASTGDTVLMSNLTISWAGLEKL